MSKLELDDQILNHPKFIRARKSGGSEAIDLWLGIRAYCGQHLSDGFVPADMLDEVRGPTERKRKAALQVLKDVALVHAVEKGRVLRCEKCSARPVPADFDGLLMHDFLDWSSSKEQVLERRWSSNDRNALRADPDLMRAVKDRDGNRCRYCGTAVNWNDKRGPMGGTYSYVTPLEQQGANDPTNIVVSCRGCSAKKRNRKLTECGLQLLPVPTTSNLPVDDDQIGEPDYRSSTSASASASAKDSEHTQGAREGEGGPQKPRVRDVFGETFISAEDQLPDSWAPNAAHADLAARLGLDLDEELGIYRARRKRDGYVCGNWDADFEGWLRQAKKFARERAARPRGGPTPAKRPPDHGVNPFEEFTEEASVDG